MILRKLFKGRTLVLAFTLLGSTTVCASDLVAEYRSTIFSDLDAYEPSLSSKKTAEQIATENEYCEKVEGRYPTTKICLENRYMVQGHYKVSLTFERAEHIPVTPKAVFVKGSKSLKMDRTEGDAFNKEWSDRALTEYLGADYRRFSSAHFWGATTRTVSIEIHVKESSELEFLIRDPRVRNIEMITSPRQPLEEIAN